MTSNIKISRDTEGVRIEVIDPDDADDLAKLGPYALIIDDKKFFCYATWKRGVNVCFFEGETHGGIGLRFYGESRPGLKTGRFGPLKLEVDLHNLVGFSADLPPMHLREWAKLRPNKSYDIAAQLILTFAERVISRMEYTSTTMQDAMRLESRKIPKPLRRYLPSDPNQGALLVREQIANLTLRTEGL